MVTGAGVCRGESGDRASHSCSFAALCEEVGSRTFGDYSASEDCSKLKCTVIEQAKASGHGGNREGAGEGLTTVRGIMLSGWNCPSMNGGDDMSLALSEPVYKITCPACSKDSRYSIFAMLFTIRVRCPICYESIKAAEHFRRTELRDLLRLRGYSGYFFGANGHSFSPAREQHTP